MNDFEILITPERKWKRLALLLKSENMDKQKRKEETKKTEKVILPFKSEFQGSNRQFGNCRRKSLQRRFTCYRLDDNRV